MLIRSCVSAIMVTWSAIAGATVIDFESITFPGNPLPGYQSRWVTLITDGFLFQSTGSIWGQSGFTTNTTGMDVILISDFPGNNSSFIGTDHVIRTITMSRLDGATFSVRSFQATQIRLDAVNATSIRVIGVSSESTQSVLDFELDRINDRNGGLEDFQTFALPDSFSRVTQVTFQGLGPLGGGHFLLDNVVVPEPSTGLLLALGLVCLTAVRRRVH